MANVVVRRFHLLDAATARVLLPQAMICPTAGRAAKATTHQHHVQSRTTLQDHDIPRAPSNELDHGCARAAGSSIANATRRGLQRADGEPRAEPVTIQMI